MYNKAIIIGRLTGDLELKSTQTGIYVCSFRVAVDRRVSKGSEKKTDFISVVAWRERAEFVSKYFGKGDAIGIEGSIQTREYEDKTGAKRFAVEVMADNVFFVGGKKESPAQTDSDAQGFEVVDSSSDLPF